MLNTRPETTTPPPLQKSTYISHRWDIFDRLALLELDARLTHITSLQLFDFWFDGLKTHRNSNTVSASGILGKAHDRLSDLERLIKVGNRCLGPGTEGVYVWQVLAGVVLTHINTQSSPLPLVLDLLTRAEKKITTLSNISATTDSCIARSRSGRGKNKKDASTLTTASLGFIIELEKLLMRGLEYWYDDTKKDKEEAFKADCQTWLAKIAGNNEALKLEKQEEEKVEKEKKEEKEEGK